MTANDGARPEIVDAICNLLKDQQGLTEPQIANALDREGVARFLHAYKEYFTHDADDPTRWYFTPRSIIPTDAAPEEPGTLRPLFWWQAEALMAWQAAGRRGVVEAVTGTGKTVVGLAAADAELRDGGKVVVLVPTLDLQQQWQREVARVFPDRRVGLRGGGWNDDVRSCDVLISVVNSAINGATGLPQRGGLLIGDECHRYGAPVFATALLDAFDRRLGLTATFERNDEGLREYLTPYFGGVCFRMGYSRAVADRVTALWKVALLGVPFTAGEAAEYAEVDKVARESRRTLIESCGVTPEPFGEFMLEVSELAAEAVWNPCVGAAGKYLKAFTRRREILANASGKWKALNALRPAIANADRSLIFTQTKDAARRAADVVQNSGIAADAITSDSPGDERSALLESFRRGTLRVLAAPKVLDEGVDVPAADLGLIVAASRQRRQMIQRMGRVIRRKGDDRYARFVILYVLGTSEDPRTGAHEAFLDEILPEAVAVEYFTTDGAEQLRAFLEPVRPEARLPPLLAREALTQNADGSREALIKELRGILDPSDRSEREKNQEARRSLREQARVDYRVIEALRTLFVDEKLRGTVKHFCNEIGIAEVQRTLAWSGLADTDDAFHVWAETASSSSPARETGRIATYANGRRGVVQERADRIERTLRRIRTNDISMSELLRRFSVNGWHRSDDVQTALGIVDAELFRRWVRDIARQYRHGQDAKRRHDTEVVHGTELSALWRRAQSD
jgi:superfamily II DNA or RNA helicase